MKKYTTTKNTLDQVQSRVLHRNAQTPWIALLEEVDGKGYDKVTCAKLLSTCLPKDDWSGTDNDRERLVDHLFNWTCRTV